MIRISKFRKIVLLIFVIVFLSLLVIKLNKYKKDQVISWVRVNGEISLESPSWIKPLPHTLRELCYFFINKEIKRVTLRNVQDISILQNLDNLQELYLISVSLENLEDISHFTKLTDLNLVACKIKDISAIKGFPSLVSLDLWQTEIDDINQLSELESERPEIEILSKP
jgi:Leucine-rich repeat (LRR) protein